MMHGWWTVAIGYGVLSLIWIGLIVWAFWKEGWH